MGFEVCLTATVEEDFIHDVTKETNRRSRLAPFRGGHVATPSMLMMTPNREEGESTEAEEEPNSLGTYGFKTMNRDRIHSQSERRRKGQRTPKTEKPESREEDRTQRTVQQK